MTIGIAAYGPEAGRAVLDGVRAAEVLGQGSIGGFAVFSAIDGRGVHHQLVCQNGGVSGLEGAEAFYAARCAAVISSGPNRPEPLSQFLPALASVALVTGHRLPQRLGASGEPMNAAVLGRIGQGDPAVDAVRAVLDENPEADVGLIAVTPDGRIGFGNSERVKRRNDLFEASHLDQGRGYALLGNSIFFNQGNQPGDLIGSAVWSRLSGSAGNFFIARLSGPVPVTVADRDRIELDDDGNVVRLQRADPWMPSEPSVATVIYSRAEVWQGGRRAGTCMTEVFACLGPGMAVPDASRQTCFAVERS